MQYQYRKHFHMSIILHMQYIAHIAGYFMSDGLNKYIYQQSSPNALVNE